MKIEKTNVMRILDQKKIAYEILTYNQEETDGKKVAELVGKNPESVFKTLVTIGKSNNYYVFMVPVINELDLKKAAKAVSEKSIEMIKQKDLLPLTGYVHGGCSPIGMKKKFKTVIDSSANKFDEILFSAGKKGFQIQTKLESLKEVVDLEFFDIMEIYG